MANPANVANLANANCCAFASHYTTGSVLNAFDTPYIVRPVREAPRDKYLSQGLCLFTQLHKDCYHPKALKRRKPPESAPTD